MRAPTKARLLFPEPLGSPSEECGFGPAGAPKGDSLAAFIVRNRIRHGSLLELDSILAPLASDAGVRVEALYSAPAPRSLWAVGTS